MNGAVGNNAVGSFRDPPTLEALYQEAVKINVRPGWLQRDEPASAERRQSEYLPGHWRYDLCKAALDAAGRLIDVSSHSACAARDHRRAWRLFDC